MDWLIICRNMINKYYAPRDLFTNKKQIKFNMIHFCMFNEAKCNWNYTSIITLYDRNIRSQNAKLSKHWSNPQDITHGDCKSSKLNFGRGAWNHTLFLKEQMMIGLSPKKRKWLLLHPLSFVFPPQSEFVKPINKKIKEGWNNKRW